MAADIRQSAFSQSQPGSAFVNPIPVCEPSATVSGNAIIAFGASSYDVSAQTFTCTDTLGQTYTQIDYLSQSGAYNFATFICQNALSLPAPVAITFTGSVAISAASTTLSSPWAGTTATYIIRFSTGECRASTLTNGSTTCTWSQGLGQAATASATAGSGPYFNQSGGNGDATVAGILEIENVPPSGVLVAHNAAIRNSITNGANTLNPGSLACGSGNGLLVMLVANATNNTGSPSYTPLVGTSPVSFTQFGSSFVNYGGDIATNAFIWQSAHLTAPGTITPTAGTQETGAETYYVFGMFFADAAPIVRKWHGTVARGSGSVTPTTNGSYAAGDTLIYYTYQDSAGTNGSAVVSGINSPWTAIDFDTNAPQLRAFRLNVVTGSESIPTATWGTGQPCGAKLVCLSGVDPSATGGTPVDRVTNTTGNIVSPTVGRTPSVDGCYCSWYGTHVKTATSNTNSWTPPTSFTLLDSDNPPGGAAAFVLGEWIQSTATAIGASIVFTAATPDTSAAMQSAFFILAPARTAPPPSPPTSKGGMNVQVCM
jgi:hypothetical protein